MLHADTTAFLLVTSAQREPIDEAIWFRRTLEEGGLPFAGVVVNRVHHDLLGDARAGRRRYGARRRAAGRSWRRGHGELPRLPRAGAPRSANIARLTAELGDDPLLLVPHLDDDVHDIDGLLADAPLPVRVARRARADDREGRRLSPAQAASTVTSLPPRSTTTAAPAAMSRAGPLRSGAAAAGGRRAAAPIPPARRLPAARSPSLWLACGRDRDDLGERDRRARARGDDRLLELVEAGACRLSRTSSSSCAVTSCPLGGVVPPATQSDLVGPQLGALVDRQLRLLIRPAPVLQLDRSAATHGPRIRASSSSRVRLNARATCGNCRSSTWNICGGPLRGGANSRRYRGTPAARSRSSRTRPRGRPTR